MAYIEVSLSEFSKRKQKTIRFLDYWWHFPLWFKSCHSGFVFLHFSLANKRSLKLSKIGSDKTAKVFLSIKLVCGMFSLLTWAIPLWKTSRSREHWPKSTNHMHYEFGFFSKTGFQATSLMKQSLLYIKPTLSNLL